MGARWSRARRDRRLFRDDSDARRGHAAPFRTHILQSSSDSRALDPLRRAGDRRDDGAVYGERSTRRGAAIVDPLLGASKNRAYARDD